MTLETYQNVYRYDPATLWIAYGLSVLFATLAVIVGTTTLVLSGVSYSHNFSTVVRVSRTANLSVEVLKRDGFGADPLPNYLKDARLDVGARNTATAADAYEMPEVPVEEQSLVARPESFLPHFD